MYEKDIESLRSQLLLMQQEQKEMRDSLTIRNKVLDTIMTT
jgi:hypothetical protein